jgi:hypothetical protein
MSDESERTLEMVEQVFRMRITFAYIFLLKYTFVQNRICYLFFYCFLLFLKCTLLFIFLLPRHDIVENSLSLYRMEMTEIPLRFE